MKILIADDHAANRHLLEQFLSAHGHQVVQACDGQEAWAAVQTARPDAIVSDALMPRVDGFQFCRMVKQHPDYFRIPFLFYTATYTDQADEQFARRIGADDFVIKPGDLADLLRRVDRERQRPRTAPLPGREESGAEVLEEYSKRLSIRLEAKVAELEEANSSLRQSEQSVRQLNERLSATVLALEREIGERNAVEAALRMREEMLRNAQAVGRIGSFQLACGGRQLDCSREACRIFELSESEKNLPTAAFLERVHGEDREKLERLYKAAAEKGADFECEHRYLLRDGGVRHLFVRIATFHDGHSAPAVQLGVVQDITRRKEAELQRSRLETQLLQAQKMEAIGNLAGGIAHDFNNVLTAILANAEMLQMELPTQASQAHLRESAAAILAAGMRARDLVKQILTFSRNQQVERAAVDPVLLVQDVMKLLRSSLPKTVDLKTDFTPTPPILGNEAQLHQVILNLCTNASHAVDKQDGAITVGVSPYEASASGPHGDETPALRPGRYARLQVRDNGCGIPPSVLPRIFEPFFTTKPSDQGTGLGLAVVHGIVQSHGGVVLVDSTVGQGTTFTIYLPALDVQPRRESAPASAPSRGQGQRVLFVDDEPSVAKIATKLLAQLGYNATSFTDSVAAQQELLSRPNDYDLVITDYLMPRLTGIDLAKAVHAARPDLPLLLAAGFGGQLDEASVRAKGFRGFISKPFSAQTLATAVRRALEGETSGEKPKVQLARQG